jgi:hypothetical protein
MWIRGAASAGGVAYVGVTNAGNASDLAGWFNVQSFSVGDAWINFGGSRAAGANGMYVQLYVNTPGVSALPVNYTNINTITRIAGQQSTRFRTKD